MSDVECVPDYAVGALAELLGDIVALVDDKLLVEDLWLLSEWLCGHPSIARPTLKTFLPFRSDMFAVWVYCVRREMWTRLEGL